MDYPRLVIMEMATKTILEYGGPTRARVRFKFTCEKCGTRCTFNEVNVLWERGECFACGHDQPIEKAGYVLELGIFPVQPLRHADNN